MRQLQLLSLLFAFLTFTAAWRLADDNEAAQNQEMGLERRQDSSSSNTGSASSGRSTASATGKSSASATNSDSSASTSGGKTQSGSGTQKTTEKASKTTDKSSATTEFDPRLPAGGISMITPAVISGPQYYRIGDWVTFAWNYTSLSVTPKHIDVLASCSANQQTYTLQLNQTVQPTGKVLWDTGAYQKTATVPLLTETYTLVIYDAQSSVSASPRAGYLAVFDTWTFGMYEPQTPTPLADFQCPTCSGAMTSMERQTLGFLFAMTGITVLTFTWFANSFGVF